MAEENDASLGPMGPWLDELLVSLEREIRARRLVLTFEFDPRLIVLREETLGAAIRELFQFILATVPDGCEVYFGGTRSLVSVSRLGAGHWSARWQVAGDALVDRSGMTALHPRRGDAQRHLASSLATRVREAFARTRWDISLEAIAGGGECLARASYE